MRKLLIALAMAGSLAPSSAPAAICSGASPFPDIAASSGFCSNVEWMKNRAITLGCPGGLYCPNDPVTRLQMTAFMNRLADAIVQQPLVNSANPGALDLTLPGIANVVCPVIVPAAAYPRTLIAMSHVSLVMSAPGSFDTSYVYTLDGDTTHWNGTSGYAAIASADSTHWGTTAQSNVIDIPAGATVKVGVTVNRADPGGSGAVFQSYCALTVLIQSRSGTTSPY